MFNGKKIKALEQRVADLEETNAAQSARIDWLFEVIALIDNRFLIRDAKQHNTQLDQLVMGRLLKIVAVKAPMEPSQLNKEFLKISAAVEAQERARVAETN